MKPFYSDNNSPISKNFLKRIDEINQGYDCSYGDDEISRCLQEKFSKFFNSNLFLQPIISGSAANQISIRTMLPKGGHIFCHEGSHILINEKDSHKVINPDSTFVQIKGEDGKINLEEFKKKLNDTKFSSGLLSITQITERGTIYSVKELRELFTLAKEFNLKIHIDGARLIYALIQNNSDVSEITSYLGVDIISFGTTKLGTMGAEAIVLFDRERENELENWTNSFCHIPSKMRFISVQLLEFLENNSWEALARKAVDMAKYFEKNLKEISGIEIQYKVEANHIFFRCSEDIERKLNSSNYSFYSPEEGLFRIVTSFYTTKHEIDEFIEILKS